MDVLRVITEDLITLLGPSWTCRYREEKVPRAGNSVFLYRDGSLMAGLHLIEGHLICRRVGKAGLRVDLSKPDFSMEVLVAFMLF